MYLWKSDQDRLVILLHWVQLDKHLQLWYDERLRIFRWKNSYLFSKICPHIAWRFVFFMFGLMGFFWTFMWIVTYRDLGLTIANIGNDEAFTHPSSKVLTLRSNKNFIRICSYFS